MVAHGRLDVFADCLHPLEHQIHDAARLVGIFTISRDGQQTGSVVHRNTDKFTHIAFFHAELVRNGDDGLMAGQQAVVSTEDGAGVVRVLVVHTRHDLIIGGDIEAGLRGIDIVRVELLAHRLVDILLCIVDVELRTHLIRLVLVQLLLIAGDIRVVLRLGLTVLDHVLFVLLLCAGTGDFLAVGDGLVDGALVQHSLHHAEAAEQHGADHRCGGHLLVPMGDRKEQRDQIDLLLLIFCLVIVHTL